MPRLMVLDALIGAPEVEWLPSAREKAEHCIARLHVPVECLRSGRYREGVASSSRLFPDALPVGIDAADRMLFVHTVTAVSLEGFGPFLRRHRALMAVLPAWTLRLIVCRDDRSAEPTWRAVVGHEIGSLLGPPDGRWDHDDIEVTTEHYRGAHAASVGHSGFSCYGGSTLRIGGRGGAGRGGGHHGGLAEEMWD